MAQGIVSTPALHGIILAAGYSSRMGGQPKALLPLGNSTMLEMAVTCFTASGIADIRVVTGHEHDRVAAAALALGAHPVYNQDFAKGMLSSVQAGIASLCGNITKGQDTSISDAVLILPVDAPLVVPATIQTLKKVWLGTGYAHNAVILPTKNGKTGHPPLIGPGHFAAIAAWQEHGGLRGYLASLLSKGAAHSLMAGNAPENLQEGGSVAFSGTNASPVIFAPVADAGILADIDTPEALSAAQDFLSEGASGTSAFHRTPGSSPKAVSKP